MREDDEAAFARADIDVAVDRAHRRAQRRRLGRAYVQAVETDDAQLTRLRAHLARRLDARWDKVAGVLRSRAAHARWGAACWLDEALVEGEQRLILTRIKATTPGRGVDARVVEEVRAFAQEEGTPLIIGRVTRPEYWSRPARSWARDRGERTGDGHPNLRYDPPVR